MYRYYVVGTPFTNVAKTLSNLIFDRTESTKFGSKNPNYFLHTNFFNVSRLHENQYLHEVSSIFDTIEGLAVCLDTIAQIFPFQPN